MEIIERKSRGNDLLPTAIENKMSPVFQRKNKYTDTDGHNN